jgi:hypothetical protein
MEADTFWRTVIADRTNFLDRLLELLRERGFRFCVVGGQAVNAFVEPLVSLDLDLVVAADQLAELESVLEAEFTVHRFTHSLSVSAPGSDLRVQFQTDPRYSEFVDRAVTLEVLGHMLPVAPVGDVLAGKVWAVQDPARRASKRQKDFADIARLLEAYPMLRRQVPGEILDQLLT